MDPSTVVLDNIRALPLDREHSTKIGGMWTLKDEISSPKFYELLIKTELKGDTAMDLKNFYNHIKSCLNAVTTLREEILPSYQSIKRHSEFSEYFIPDRYHPSYSWNVQIYTSLGNSLLVEMDNDTSVKSSMEPQDYKVVSTHAHEISGWTILSRLIHSYDTHIGGIIGYIQPDLVTLEPKIGEQLEDFHSRILRLQQENILSW